MQIPYRATSGPPHLLIDSTGIKFSGEGEWPIAGKTVPRTVSGPAHIRKHGAPAAGAPSCATGSPSHGVRRKIHIGIDADTLDMRAVEMTGNRIGDASVLPDLLAQIPADERIGSVTADGIYETKGCHAVIAARGAEAIIPPRRNARAWKGHDPGFRSRNEALRACKRFGRGNWNKWSGYHR